MTIYYLPSTYKDLLDNVDHDTGVLTWVVEKHNHDRQDFPGVKADIWAHRKARAKHMLCLLNMWVTDRPVTSSKVILAALDPQVIEHPTDEKFMQYSINVCPIFGLPGEDPAAELASIQKLMDCIKGPLDWFVEMNNDNVEEATCQFFNSRKTPVNESVEFHWGEGLLDEVGNAKMRQATKDLHVLIASDPNLQKFMAWLRRQFNAMGPYSWWNVKQDYMYESYDSPSSDRFRRLFKGPTWKEVERMRNLDRKTLK